MYYKIKGYPVEQDANYSAFKYFNKNVPKFYKSEENKTLKYEPCLGDYLGWAVNPILGPIAVGIYNKNKYKNY